MNFDDLLQEHPEILEHAVRGREERRSYFFRNPPSGNTGSVFCAERNIEAELLDENGDVIQECIDGEWKSVDESSSIPKLEVKWTMA